MSNINTAGLIAKRRYAKHRVGFVDFSGCSCADEAPLECACGWHGTVGQWDLHRKDEQANGKASVSRAPTELEQFERVH